MNMQRQLKPVVMALSMAGMLMAAPGAVAGERESLEQLRNTTMSLIDLLVQEGVLSKSKAEGLIREAEAARRLAAESEPVTRAEADAAKDQSAGGDKVVRVQYVPEHVKKELREELKKEVMAKAQSEGWAYPGSIPEWLNRIEWMGDLRLRYELDSFPQGNDPVSNFTGSVLRNADIPNTTDERHRTRVRARLGANIKINDWLSGGIRMTTGKVDDSVSPNQTMESTDSKYSFALDRAFLKAQATDWLSVSGGRFENPFFSTDLVWDPDLAFDGVAATFKPRFSDNWSAFGTLGAFPIDEVQSSETNRAKDKWLFGAQAGLQWKGTGQSSAKFGVALYDYQNVEGTPNDLDGVDDRFNSTVPVSRQKGNSTFDINRNGVASCGIGTGNNGCGLASKFRELDLTGQIDLAMFNPVHVILTADYVRNLGFDEQEIFKRTGQPLGTYDKENEAYQVKLAIGMPDTLKRHDWQVFGAYKYIEADAVLDAFTDSDFNLGGTNAKGWVLGASYGLDKNTWLSARFFSADEIIKWNQAAATLTGRQFSSDVLLIDLNAKF